MRIKESNKMKPSINKAILFFGCLFAVINLYGQGQVLSTEPDPSTGGTFIIKKESSDPGTVTTRTAVAQEPVQTTPAVSSSKATTTVQTDAQKTCGKHEFSLWGAGGFSTLYYDPTFGDWSPGLGGAFGLGYTFYFSKNFGILAGAEVAFYNAKMKVDGLTDSYNTKDPTDGYDVNYRTKLLGYEEEQQLINVNIPVALQYQTNGKHKFFALLGVKLGIPVSGTYKDLGNSTLVTSGYYPDLNQEFFEPVYLGYGTFKGKGSDKDIDFGIACIGTVEAGMKWRLNDVWSLYTGAYLDYGFNDVVDGHSNKFLIYNKNSPANFKTNSVLTSQYTEYLGTKEVIDPATNKKSNEPVYGNKESFTDRVSPAAVGLKLRLGMNVCTTPKEKKDRTPAPPKPKPTPTPTPTPAPVPPKPVPPKETKVKEEQPVDFMRLSDEEIEEDLRRAVSEYGSSVKGTISIELEGYELDQSKLSPKMERILDEKIAEIRQRFGNDISIICEGHTCNAGKEAYNLTLGQKRAEVVRQYLIKKGFGNDKVTAISKGQSTPIFPNDNEVNRKKNRRVVLIVR